MKPLISGLSAAGLIGCASLAGAAELPKVDFSGNVGLFSDYAFRGISQTAEKPALQGGIDISAALNPMINAYAGFWGSNVDFGDTTQLELDAYAGVNGPVADTGLTWGLQYLYYFYPGASNTPGAVSAYEYYEIIPSVSIPVGPASVGLSLAYSPNFFGGAGTNGAGDAFYWHAGGDVPLDFGREGILFAGWSVGAGLGYQNIEDNAAFGTPSYFDWSITLSKSFEGAVDVSVAYIDTDLNGSGCFGATDDVCDARAIVSVSKSFP